MHGQHMLQDCAGGDGSNSCRRRSGGQKLLPRLSRLPLLDAVQLLLSLLGHSCGHVGCGCAGGGHRKPDIGRQSLGRSRGQGPVDSRVSLEIALGGCRCGGRIWSVSNSICFFTADCQWKLVRPSFSKIFTTEKSQKWLHYIVEARPVELLNGMTEGLVGMKLLASKEAMAGGGGKGG